MAESYRELTERSQDHLPSYPDIAWRGHAYLEHIEPILPEASGFGEDVTDGQRCWVGYVPSTDEFLLGYDLWLREVSEEGEATMAGGLTRVRLSTSTGELVVSLVAHDRFPHSIYSGDTLDVIQARFPDLIEIDID